jgi:hypothetical protein
MNLTEQKKKKKKGYNCFPFNSSLIIHAKQINLKILAP